MRPRCPRYVHRVDCGWTGWTCLPYFVRRMIQRLMQKLEVWLTPPKHPFSKGKFCFFSATFPSLRFTVLSPSATRLHYWSSPASSAWIRPVATDVELSVVCVSVSMSVCWAHRSVVQKRLNRSRCHLVPVWHGSGDAHVYVNCYIALHIRRFISVFVDWRSTSLCFFARLF